ncbi:MAG TPA: hypothetical protein PKY82_05120 [Pyrinomonadaceae bacterium]|nr:hypothetical protein [Pyrinomonadaceae bacterium]
MFQNLTFNSILWMVIGLGLFGWGLFNVWSFRHNPSALANLYVFPSVAGFILLGLASILCGYTNGFTDYTRRGQAIKKIAVFLAVAGLPLAGFAIWRSL